MLLDLENLYLTIKQVGYTNIYKIEECYIQKYFNCINSKNMFNIIKYICIQN